MTDDNSAAARLIDGSRCWRREMFFLDQEELFASGSCGRRPGQARGRALMPRHGATRHPETWWQVSPP
jgi:hypothetical protein